MKPLQRISILTCALVASSPAAWAADPTDDLPNNCTPIFQGSPCSVENDYCRNASLAKLCVNSTCQIPCEDQSGQPKPLLCSLGETCVAGRDDYNTRYFCQKSTFTVDLNLLDSCITHFLSNIIPDLSSKNTCSLQRNLDRLLDQDGNGVFDIFDVDLCIRAFLDTPPCDPVARTCPGQQTYCDRDDECGEGLFCNLDLHRCERECGFVASREGNTLVSLERQCSGALMVCDYYRGKCHQVDLTGSTCQIDADCPAGAYCFLGQCQKKCYRSIDCPDSGWYCSETNTCRPKPSAGSTGAAFDPREYTVLFGQKSFTLDAVNDAARIPLVVMSIKTQKQVFSDPQVVFGYRLEAKYSRKQAAACMKDPAQWTEDERRDCLIDDTEEWVTLENPFGTVFADGTPTFGIRLNNVAAGRLTPGLYEATITAIYSNGGSDSATIKLRKTSPSGQYAGRLSIYVDSPDNLLGNTDLSMKLYISQSSITWDAFLRRENLFEQKEFEDLTSGYEVAGTLSGDDSMVFNNPKAGQQGQTNLIPVKGIYSPHLGRMRLIGVIDIEKNFCRGETGACNPQKPNELRAANVFGRKIRRQFHFVGPYDERLRLFHGMYRETISGLSPDDVTLDGGFRLAQSTSDETPFSLSDPLLPAASSAAVGFPPLSELLGTLESEIAASCTGTEKNKFSSQAAYEQYLLREFDSSGPIFRDLATFTGLIGTALRGLNNDKSAYLTINDFLRGQNLFCKPGQTESCVDPAKVRCGLALYQKAILSGWWDPIDLTCEGASEPGPCQDLFCAPANPPITGCTIPASDNPSLKTLQEHGRFYQELSQTLSYQAGNELSDAFFVLYRSQASGLGGSAAYSYKEDRLRAALLNYEKMRQQVFLAAPTGLLFQWPIQSFKGVGSDWLRHLHTILEDRMLALEEMISLKRRLFQNTTPAHADLIQHILQEEFLTQAFLIALEKEWHGASFQYGGSGPRILEIGARIVGKVQSSRNPLGLYPNRIYFENSNLALTNWQNYRDRILKPGDGFLAEAETAVTQAIGELRGSLRDRDTFEGGILSLRQDLDATLDRLCGPTDPVPPTCDKGDDEKKIESQCSGPSCPFAYQCEGKACDQVIQAFQNSTGNGFDKTACRLDSKVYKIQVGADERLCVRGEVGSLQQERILLDLKRKQVVHSVQSLLRQISTQQQFIRETQSANEDLMAFLDLQNTRLAAIEMSTIAANYAYEEATASAGALDCWVIAGLAFGTNCPQKMAQSAIISVASAVRNAVLNVLDIAKMNINQMKEVKFTESSQNAELRKLRLELQNLVVSVENQISEYELLTQQLFNLDQRTQDSLFVAQQTANRYSESLGYLVDRLIGRESGSVLLRNHYVAEANRKFDDLLLEAYKMGQAFMHRYNMLNQADALADQVYKALTVADVRQFVNDLNRRSEEYCGAQCGLDCDWVNNPQVLRFSLQEQLFPALRDIVDAKTGAVLTREEQFHNLITSSTFMKRTKREGAGSNLQTQIELPFAIWLNDRGITDGVTLRFLISENECNHVIVGTSPSGNVGTIAVNLIGTRLSKDVTFELWRGGKDEIRSCTPEQVSVDGLIREIYPIRTYTVGFAPQSAQAQQGTPPSFLSWSQELQACRNDTVLEAGQYANSNCFRYFARDRSLAAPDWKIVIPRLDAGGANRWLLGDGLGPNERPIIGDIVLYIRNSGRPITGGCQ